MYQNGVRGSEPALPPEWPPQWAFPPDPAPVESKAGMVVTTDRYASDVGVEVLRRGGNAMDATVSVHFALAVVNPEAGNLGGGGFLIHHAATGEFSALDFRSCAPGAATTNMFVDISGGVGDRSVHGPLAACVPGSVRGMWDAHRRHGLLPWSELVDPAVELARGFRVTERLVRSFEPHIVEGLRRYPASAEIFLPDGGVPRIGSTFVQADLAGSLERIRDRGPDGFYGGVTARLLVDEMERGGGILSADDLRNYETRWRDPLRCPYRDRTLVSMPPPSSGGVTLAAIANILTHFDLSALDWHGPRHAHLLAEAWSRAFADRNYYLGDPAFCEMPLDVLRSRQYGAMRAREIAPDRATPSVEVRPGVVGFGEGRHTTHFSIVDGHGNAVSNTTTINTWFGSKTVAAGTGVLLNNDMDDFTVKPGEPNFFGLVQGAANAISPGKRPLSAMTPTLVLSPKGSLEVVLGAPGGATIITTVFQILSNVIDHGMSLPEAVAAPRIHHQHLPDHLRVEPGGLTERVVDALRGMGHGVVEHFEMAGDAQVVRVEAGGRLLGQSDPRRGGAAAGV